MYLQDPQIMKQYLRQHSHLLLHKRVLYGQVSPSKEDMNGLQLVITQSYQKKALQGCHDDIRHMGLQQVLDLLWDQFYWPRMTKDAELHIVRYDQCIHFKSRPQKTVMELVQLDYLKIEVTEGGKEVHVLVIIDHFTQCAQALVTSLLTDKCTAQALWD